MGVLGTMRGVPAASPRHTGTPHQWPRSPLPLSPGASKTPRPRGAGGGSMRHHLHHRRGRALPWLVGVAVLLGVAQLAGWGPNLRRALLARCPAYAYESALKGRPLGGLWGTLCAHEAMRVSAAAAYSTHAGSTRNRTTAATFLGTEYGVTVPYDPSEWPSVYGGQAEPHKRIMKRCTGSLFVPPVGPDAQPGRGVVGVWDAKRFRLQFCDMQGRTALLSLLPAPPVAASTDVADGARHLASADDLSYGSGVTRSARRRLADAAAADGDTTAPAVHNGHHPLGALLGFLTGRAGRRLSYGSQPLVNNARMSATAAELLAIELATSRALVADGGSVRIAWADNATLLADGVTAFLSGGGACPSAPHDWPLACVAVPAGAVLSDTTYRRMGRQAPAGGSGAGANPLPPAPARTHVLVLAGLGDRAVLRIVLPDEDVAAAARLAAEAVAAPSFTRNLEAAVAAAVEALRDVPRALGIPPMAPPEDKQLARKLADIMAANTGPDWTTPDRTPHGWQWLWDSAFHAMGAGPLNHTSAWLQLQGLLEHCQAANGFVPHLCRGGPPSTITQPPLLAWAVWDNYLFARDRRRLEWAVPRLIKQLNWLEMHRSHDGGATHYYAHAFESGMDNSPRFEGTGRSLSAQLSSWFGALTHGIGGGPAPATHAASVDLTALVARECAMVSRMLDELGRRKEAARWLARSREIAALLAVAAWNPRTRMFGDILYATPEGGGSAAGGGGGTVWRVSDLVTVAGLLPLLAGPLPLEHLQGLLRNLKDPAVFATPVPLPSAVPRAANGSAAAGGSYSSDMWRGPMWVNTNYMVAVGLREQPSCSECRRLARWITRSTIAEVRKWYAGGAAGTPSPDGSSTAAAGKSTPNRSAAATGSVFEYYDSQGRTPPTRLARKGANGVGGVRDYHWTAALTLRMLAEEQALAAASQGMGGGMGTAIYAGNATSAGMPPPPGLWSGGAVGGGLGSRVLPAWVPARPLWPEDGSSNATAAAREHLARLELAVAAGSQA